MYKKVATHKNYTGLGVRKWNNERGSEDKDDVLLVHQTNTP